MSKLLSFFFILITLLTALLEGTYIERFSSTENGGIAFTGNSVGLGKARGKNNPGKNDSIGAFMTTNTELQVNDYPPGTTLNISENSSAAYLDLPVGSDILYAELIWSGSYGFPLNDPLLAPPDDSQVSFTTPQNITHQIRADKTTAQNDLTPGFKTAGNYVRSANVTSLVQLGGRGVYIAGQIPGTVHKNDEEHNAAGWTLAVVYKNPKMYTSKLMLWVGCEQGKANQAFHVVDDFTTPSRGIKNGRLFVSAIEGDAVREGDHILFGSHSNLKYPDDALSGTNNPIHNFFASQINTLVDMNADQNGKLVHYKHAQLDTRGTFGSLNQDALNKKNVEGGRQGYDITSIDISDKLEYNQKTVYLQGQTLEGDEDYTIGALALQLQVDAPIIRIEKLIDYSDSPPIPQLGQVLNFQLAIENTGTKTANKVIGFNLLQRGLNFVPGSFKINGASMPDRYVQLLPIGDLQIDEVINIEYQATVDSKFLEGKPKFKSTKVDYCYHIDDETLSKTLTTSSGGVFAN